MKVRIVFYNAAGYNIGHSDPIEVDDDHHDVSTALRRFVDRETGIIYPGESIKVEILPECSDSLPAEIMGVRRDDY
jgi:hypothetical protein